MSLSINDIAPAITGDELLKAMAESRNKRKPLIEGLVYERTTLMVSADPGTGKSTIATQMMIEAAAGLPVFGTLHVDRPLKFLFAQTERSIVESLERLDHISKIYPIVKENIIITDEYQRFNLLNQDHVHMMVKCIKRDCPAGVDVIVWDPIYCMVAGGLSKDEPASLWCHAMSIIHKEIGAAHWYNHHTVKPEYKEGVKYVRDDPFYGSRWLNAHCTGAYYMERSEKGVRISCKKDNYAILGKCFELEYDSETGLSVVPFSELPAIERVKNFVDARKIDNKTFCFDEMVKATGLSVRICRSILSVHSPISDRFVVVSSIKNKHLYKAAP